MSKGKKALGLDSQGIQKTMRFHDYLGDGVGTLTLNFISNIIGVITYFYTDKVGIAAAAVGTILLLAKIIDAFTDIIMGRIIDVTKTKFGKVRHWFLWMAVPAGIIIIALFCVPAGASQSSRSAYVLITNILATAVIYTSLAIPYGCLFSLRTKSTEERSKMGIVRAIFGYTAGIIVTVALIPLTNALGGKQDAWIKISIVFGIIAAVSMLITFATSKEENQNTSLTNEDSEEKVSFKESVNILFKNKYWVIMLFAMLIVNIDMSLASGTGVYYAKYILHNDNLVSVMGAVGLIPVIVGFALTNPMIKKFGLAKACRVALIVGIISTGIRCFMPTSFMAALTLGSIATFATIPLMAVGGVLVNNTIEYNEWKFGKRLVGMSNSVNSFGTKIGGGLGTAMIGWLLAFGNYNGTLKVQPQSASSMILFISIYLPLILLVICYFILRKYDLDSKYPQIVKELSERKALKQSAE